MKITDFLDKLRKQGIVLWTEDGALRYRAPEGKLSDTNLSELRVCKDSVIAFLEESGRRSLVEDLEHRFEPFPLTDIQQSYWLGREGTFEEGHVSSHVYNEVELAELDLDRLGVALNLLIARHEMLRTVFEGGQQRILAEVPACVIPCRNLSELDPRQRTATIEEARDRMSHQVLAADTWPLFEIMAFRMDANTTRVLVSFDLLIGDAWSFYTFYKELFRLYADPSALLPQITYSYRDYVLSEKAVMSTASFERARRYWLQRVPTLPPAPGLPLLEQTRSTGTRRFARLKGRLPRERWTRFKAEAARHHLTPSAAVLSAFALVLRTWVRESSFTLNLTYFNRKLQYPGILNVMGDFTSSLLLEVNPGGDDTFSAMAARVQQQLFRDLENADFGGTLVVRDYARVHGLNAAKLLIPVVFSSLLAWKNDDIASTSISPLAGANVIYGISQTPEIWLDHQTSESDGALAYNWDYVSSIFPEGVMEQLFDAYSGLIEKLSDEDARWSEHLPSLVPAPQLSLRETVNSTQVSFPDLLLQQEFWQHEQVRPSHAAVVCEGRTITYAELARDVRNLTIRLRVAGARANKPIPVIVRRGAEKVLAAVAILESGAAYVPIDPDLPADRIKLLLADLEANLLVVGTGVSAVWPNDLRTVLVDDFQDDVEESLPSAPAKTSDLAYVIYTSGSTGKPKGVMVSHRAAVNTIQDVNRRIQLSPEDRVLAISSLSFDLSVFDIFGALSAGATIIMPDEERRKDPALWAQLVMQEKVTVWNSVPALMELVVEIAKPDSMLSLRVALLSGDWIRPTLAKDVWALSPNCSVISLGGATEAAIWSIYQPIEVKHTSSKSIPYGKPLANQAMHVLNDNLEPMPALVTGELYIEGSGLAEGYWGDPERTASRFILQPQTGRRLYRTGDLGRYLADGAIEFQGREDSQVKVNGHRVELGEIEYFLNRLPGVLESVVVAKDVDHAKRLHAYLRHEAPGSVTTVEIKMHLMGLLPSYMVPTAFEVQEHFPLTPNGKIDRAALARLSSEASKTAEKPSLSVLHTVRDAVRGLLSEEVEDDEDLLLRGLTSIDVVRALNLLQGKIGVRPSIDLLYRKPTITGWSETYQAAASEGQGLDPSSLSAPGLLTDPTERAAFKTDAKAIRELGDHAVFALARRPLAFSSPMDRRSHRTFLPATVVLEDLAMVLSAFREEVIDGSHKYFYPSAGGLYPVQTYLHVKQERVKGLPGGSYYYHPRNNTLVLLEEGVALDPEVHDPLVNRPIFRQASFSIFLVVEMSAIEPMYGKDSLHFAALEAGYMGQLLMTSAGATPLGLCPIGGLRFKEIRESFALGPSQTLLHSFLGGVTPTKSADFEELII